jgi:hypothetical protein
MFTLWSRIRFGSDKRTTCSAVFQLPNSEYDRSADSCPYVLQRSDKWQRRRTSTQFVSKTKLDSVALARKLIIPIELQPLVGEVSVYRTEIMVYNSNH